MTAPSPNPELREKVARTIHAGLSHVPFWSFVTSLEVADAILAPDGPLAPLLAENAALGAQVEAVMVERDDQASFATGWHRCVETILTVLELSPALGAAEAATAVRDHNDVLKSTLRQATERAERLEAERSLNWREPGSAPEDGQHVIAQVTTSYRYKLYRLDGQRQMRQRGRWQRANDYGWENCDPPQGAWMPAKEYFAATEGASHAGR